MPQTTRKIKSHEPYSKKGGHRRSFPSSPQAFPLKIASLLCSTLPYIVGAVRREVGVPVKSGRSVIGMAFVVGVTDVIMDGPGMMAGGISSRNMETMRTIIMWGGLEW